MSTERRRCLARISSLSVVRVAASKAAPELPIHHNNRFERKIGLWLGLAEAASPVEKFFEFSLLGLLASGFLAVAGLGYLDAPTVAIMAVALVARLLNSASILRIEPPPGVVTIATLAYIGFYPIDYFYISQSFIPAAIHLVFFVAVVKILTGHTDRDYLLLKVIAFLELLAACIVIHAVQLFRLPAVVPGARRSDIRKRRNPPARSQISPARFNQNLAPESWPLDWLLLVMPFPSAHFSDRGGPVLFPPRTARAAFQHLISHRITIWPGFSNHVTLGEIGEIKQRRTRR